MVDIVGHTGPRLAIAREKQCFMDGQCRVDRHVILDHQVDRLLNLLAVEIDIRQARQGRQAQ